MSRLTIRRLDRVAGDIRKSWDKGKKEEVEAARADFEHFTKELKYLAYKVDPTKNDKKGEQIRFFDPNAEEIVLIPALAGG